MKTFKRNSFQEIAEIETKIDPTAGEETIQETTIEREVEITTIGIEVEIVETIVEIEVEAEVEIGLIPEKEEETNQDLDQIKDILTGMTSAITATELVMQHIIVLDWIPI